MPDLCAYCRLLEIDTCDNYPDKGYCPAGWQPEPEEPEPAPMPATTTKESAAA